jgi:hypothetical protein
MNVSPRRQQFCFYKNSSIKLSKRQKRQVQIRMWPYLPVATDLNVVPGDWRVICLDEMNLPVEVDLIEVLLLLVLNLPSRNLLSPIPLPGNAPVDPMWNLGDDLVLTLFTSTTSLTP